MRPTYAPSALSPATFLADAYQITSQHGGGDDTSIPPICYVRDMPRVATFDQGSNGHGVRSSSRQADAKGQTLVGSSMYQNEDEPYPRSSTNKARYTRSRVLRRRRPQADDGSTFGNPSI